MLPPPHTPATPDGRKRPGFTLIELLVSMTVLLMIMVLMLSIFSGISRTWLQSTRIIDTFQGARAGFDRMTRLLSQATLNVYTGYDDPNAPTIYRRQSELAFNVLQAGSSGVSGSTTFGTGSGAGNTGGGTGHGVFFQVPVGVNLQADYRTLSQTLSSVGFSVRLVGDDTFRPAFLNGGGRPVTSRMRLMEYITTSDRLIYGDFAVTSPIRWIDNMAGPGQPAAPTAYQYPVADNIVWMCVWPKLSPTDTTLAPEYVYYSRKGATDTPQVLTANQLPPLVQVTMVAIDERSADRFPGTEFVTRILPSFNGTLADVKKYQDDINTVTGVLTTNRIAYRVFTTTVQMRESRWSQ